MKIVCIGAGPAGLYAALLLQRQGHQVCVFERNASTHSMGLGVVLSRQGVEELQAVDAASGAAIAANLHAWDRIAVHRPDGEVESGGHDFFAIARQQLLDILRDAATRAGVQVSDGRALLLKELPPELAPESASDSATALPDADLLLACDGLHSSTRHAFAAHFAPQLQNGQCRYLWLGTTRHFSAFSFIFEPTAWGLVQAHCYQYDANHATVIIEMHEEVWQAAGLGQMADAGLSWCMQVFARHLQGHPLFLPPGSAADGNEGQTPWRHFAQLSCAQWLHHLPESDCPLVLLGDAAHSAHFSIGSGTRLAMQDAICLAQCLAKLGQQPVAADLLAALQSYQQQRQNAVVRLQNAASNSMRWFEQAAHFMHLPLPQFHYALLTRSQRVGHQNLRLRDAVWLDAYQSWFAQQAMQTAQALQSAPTDSVADTPPALTPYALRSVVLKNRIVVSPMAQYCAQDGLVGDYHLMHLGARAVGGAALVMTEMLAVSADARITPACAGLYQPAHTAAWQRIVQFVHQSSSAKIGAQLGHAGPKGATNPPALGMDTPLPTEQAWPLFAASRMQYWPGVSAWAAQLSEAQMQQVLADFVRATHAAHAAGFDWLELHCAHGYLLSSFLSPLTNQREDEYGGSLEARCRFPVQVLAAVRAAWPQHLPLSVRISAHDWVAGGNTLEEAVQIARHFQAAGADMICCSSGQVSKQEKVRYGRLFQTPFAERIGNQLQMPTMAVGAIEEMDQANSIIAAGRADLCAIGRPHLANPAWTLTQAAAIGYTDLAWPQPYLPAKRQLENAYARQMST